MPNRCSLATQITILSLINVVVVLMCYYTKTPSSMPLALLVACCTLWVPVALVGGSVDLPLKALAATLVFMTLPYAPVIRDWSWTVSVAAVAVAALASLSAVFINGLVPDKRGAIGACMTFHFTGFFTRPRVGLVYSVDVVVLAIALSIGLYFYARRLDRIIRAPAKEFVA